MTPPPKKTTDTNTRLSMVEYKVDEQKIVSDRTETKVDLIIDQLRKLNYVTIGEHEKLKADFLTFKEEVQKNYVTVESRKAWVTFARSLGLALAISFFTVVLAFILKGGLTKP